MVSDSSVHQKRLTPPQKTLDSRMLGGVHLVLDALIMVPGWACGMAAITVFLYQICDALDGKQCYRWLTNKMDYSLPELVDHASDSVSTVFVTIELAICMRLGHRPDLFLTLMFSAMFMFYTAHWQTYISGVVRFGTLDVTESELALCFGFLLTAILGQQFWVQKVFGMEWRGMIVLAVALMGAIKFINHAIYIWRRGHRLTTGGTSVLSPLMGISTIFFLAVVTKATTNLFDHQPCIFLIVFALLEAKMSNKLIIAYMTKSELTQLDSILLGPIVLLANQLLGNPLSGHILLWATLVYAATDLFIYLRKAILDICDLLDQPFISRYPIKDTANGNGCSDGEAVHAVQGPSAKKR
ncbi:cholinephosphotransferase 1-like isoform X2 [Acanthaster planci]|uniref:Cholinephosphotransferase 1-like isoform X2 n=1 Tax=Acanthaster planci TaxID=133434 RepID=A0A8B7YJC0_ACAPL|nr:cholinephosphotransferase 1-like isoform X2 [Acanthaster planci]